MPRLKSSSESRSPVKLEKTATAKSDPSVSYNDIDLNNWKQYDDVLTDSLWVMNSRDKTGGHQLDYHGNCIPQILTQLLTRFTKKGDVVLDLFLGSGTTAIEAERLERHCIGVELSQRMVDYVQGKLDDMSAADRHHIIRGNSQDLEWTSKQIDISLKKFATQSSEKAERGAKRQRGDVKESAQFVFMHPPYDDIIQFSDHPDDLSNQQSTDDFMRGFQDVAQQAYNKLEPGRFAAVVIGDKYANKELVPLGFMCMAAMNQVGFRTKSIIVKNMTGNERGKGRTGNLWRYRALKGGFYLFKHEYVLVFEKPAK
jgi:DNA modification methylase